jgi:hypothetical protein
MKLLPTIHQRWAAATTLSALLPAARVFTGASFDPTLPLGVITKQSDKPDSYHSDGSAIDTVVVRIHVLHAQHDAAANIVAQIKTAFDRTTFDLGGGDCVQNMQRINDSEQQRSDGTWEMIIDFNCAVYLATGT